MTFFTSTQTPLYSESWTPRSTAGYAGTCIFLIALAVVFRGIMAFKHHMEHRWLDQHLNRRYVVVAGRKNEKARTSEDGNAQTALLVSATGVEEDVRVVRRHVRGPFPWRLSIDVPRAALAVVMSGVGYLLYVFSLPSSLPSFLPSFLPSLYLSPYQPPPSPLFLLPSSCISCHPLTPHSSSRSIVCWQS